MVKATPLLLEWLVVLCVLVESPRASQATYTWTCMADGQTRSQSRIAEANANANANSKQQQNTLIIYLAHLYHQQGILSIELDKPFIIS
jgi:hypothetical protein